MKKETVEEFVARGGTIEKVPSQESKEERVTVGCSNVQHPHLASLTDGTMFFTEKTKNRKKKARPHEC